MDSLKPAATATPAAGTTPKPAAGTGYTPYQSRFAGARDAAFAEAQGQSSMNPYNPMNLFKPGGTFGGPRMQARTDYAASKGKYYSSSDQKTYGSYNDAMAAKKSRMTSLASQQRLDKLSRAGATRSSRGVRFDAEAKARRKETEGRGGVLGQIGRGFTSMFGSQKDIDRNKAADAASAARVKQAGAASIGRYFSSSDGKYYKDYKAAKLAQEQRRKSGVKPPVKPAPKVTVVNAPKGRRRGAAPGRSNGSNVPNFGATNPKGGNAKAKTLGLGNRRGG